MLLFLLACEHQYLVIPGAEVATGDLPVVVGDQAPPTWTLTRGDLDMEVGDTVTLSFPVPPPEQYTFEVTEILITVWITATLRTTEYWVYEIQEEERAAGKVELQVITLPKAPTTQECSAWRLGHRVCYGPVDEGMESTSFLYTDGSTGSLGVGVPTTLEPLVEPESQTESCTETLESCCATVDGMKPLACYVYTECGCPSGTGDLGIDGTGYRACDCPD
ncbi:MAG TPA: hypothetical protein PLA94_12150 [Myxococcota bacterium]|nr:hypothetical protein [Myxococcota bacterium]